MFYDEEEEIIERNYIFLLRRIPAKLDPFKSVFHVDSFVEIPNRIEFEYCKFTEDYSSLNYLSSYIHAFKLRQRFNGDILQQIFKVKFKGELTASDIELHINMLKADELMKFLKDAAI